MEHFISALNRDKYIYVYLKKSESKAEDCIELENGFYRMYSEPGRKPNSRINKKSPDFEYLRSLVCNYSKSNEVEELDQYEVIKEKKKGIFDSVIIYNREKCKILDCEDVNSFLLSIEPFLSNKKNNCYFRGQAIYHRWIPSLFREKKWVDNEALLNMVVENKHVNEFVDCVSTIQKLVKLKHYNQPSRLFDIVASPLMALYFACESGISQKSGGMIAVIFSNKEEEKYSQISDTVSELSALANNRKKPTSIPPHCISGGVLRCYYWKNNDKKRWKINCQGCSVKGFLDEQVHQCKKETSHELYWDDLSHHELDKCIVIHSELNNARIIHQQGLFILCGQNPVDPYLPPDCFTRLFESDKNKRVYFRFSYSALEKCKKTLERLGINESQVYFDLEKTIEYEKNHLLNI